MSKIYNHYLTLTLTLLLHTLTIFPQLTISGGTSTPYQYQENLVGTGIQSIYLLNTLTNAKIEYQSQAALVRFYKYQHSLQDAQQIPNKDILTTKDGNNTLYTITNIEDSRGYYAEENGAVTPAIWIIDYSRHLPILKSITPDTSGEECQYLRLSIDKEDDLNYYANNGTPRQIIRKYTIQYQNLVWNQENKTFEEQTITTNSYDVGTEQVIESPLINTTFTLSGDQFAQAFGITQHVQSPPYTAIATSGYIVAEQTTDEGVTNEIGGSAPANVKFYAQANEPTTHFYTWYIYKQTDTENAIARYTDKDINYIFKESGDYVVKLEIADQNSICVNTITQNLSISNFKWEVPNFMLLDGEHPFKISYKSIIQFKGAIYNRWGNEIFVWTDPSKGWDGKYKGKFVTPGVYYYVMTAISGDGKKHKKAGDINVLKKK